MLILRIPRKIYPELCVREIVTWSQGDEFLLCGLKVNFVESTNDNHLFFDPMRLSLKLSDKTYDTLRAERMMVFFGGNIYYMCGIKLEYRRQSPSYPKMLIFRIVPE